VSAAQWAIRSILTFEWSKSVTVPVVSVLVEAAERSIRMRHDRIADGSAKW